MDKESQRWARLGAEMLFLLFLGLKLSGHIDWSWWWVFAPVWGVVVLGGAVVVGTVINLALKK